MRLYATARDCTELHGIIGRIEKKKPPAFRRLVEATISIILSFLTNVF
jgi:hypothetical protein